MTFNYECDSCGKVETNDSLESMACNCGGFYRLSDKITEGTHFEPFYDRVLRSWVTSYHDQEKKMNAHRSKSHPNGLYAVQDDKKFMQECRHIKKHKEEYKEAHLPGYKAGDKNYDSTRPDIKRSGKRTFFFSR